MSDDIITISQHRVKEGRLDDFVGHYEETTPSVEANKPGTLLQAAHTNEEGSEATIIRIFENAHAMDKRLEGVDRRSAVSWQFIEPIGVEIFGSPSDAGLEMIEAVVGDSVEIYEYPGIMGGFSRFDSR